MKGMSKLRIVEIGLSIGRLIFQGSRDAIKHSHAKEMAKKERKNRRREEDDKFYLRLIERAVDTSLKSRQSNNTSDGDNTNPSAKPEPEINFDDFQLVPASCIKDRKVDSTLLGHSGGLIVINGRGGGGKTVLAVNLMAEACSGKSSNLIPDTDGATGPKYQGIYYHAEQDNNFEKNYSALTHPLSNFKVLFDMEVFEDYKKALKLIERHALEANDNVVVCIDNITAMIPSLMQNHKVTDFINGLKRIRKDVESRGFTATFIIVTHSNSNGNSLGSNDWFNLVDSAFIDVSTDSKTKLDSHRIITCTKRKGMPPFEIKAEFVKTPYLHFVERKAPVPTMTPSVPTTGNSKPTAKATPKTPSVKTAIKPSPPFVTTAPRSRKEVTLEVATMFYVENKHKKISWRKIFETHASEFDLTDRNTARNKVEALPRMLRKAFTDDILLDIWSMSEVYGKSAEDILKEVGEKYGISQISTIQYIIDKVPEITSGLTITN